MIEVLRLTGLKTPTEYMTETTKYDREFLHKGIRSWHEKKEPNRMGGGGL